MPGTTRVGDTRLPRGERMSTGKGWRLVGPGKKSFKAALLKKIKIGGETLAIFRVLPNPDSDT